MYAVVYVITWKLELLRHFQRWEIRKQYWCMYVHFLFFKSNWKALQSYRIAASLPL